MLTVLCEVSSDEELKAISNIFRYAVVAAVPETWGAVLILIAVLFLMVNIL